MNRYQGILSLMFLGLIGCGQPAEKVVVDPPAAKPVAVDLSKITLSDEEIAEIRKLDDRGDQKTAMEQKICAVNEEEGKPVHLGTMGVPIKQTVKGKTVFLCCPGCKRELEKNPDKYLARIGK